MERINSGHSISKEFYTKLSIDCNDWIIGCKFKLIAMVKQSNDDINDNDNGKWIKDTYVCVKSYLSQ